MRLFWLARAIWPDGNSIVNYGETLPTAENRIYPWIRVNPTTHVVDKTYKYQAGYWACEHPVASGSDERRLWVGSLANLVTHDGGSAGTVGDYTGPMWEQDTAIGAKFLLGCGTLPGGTVISVTDTGGEETHLLTVDEMPSHSHVRNEHDYVEDVHIHNAGGTNVGDYGGSGNWIIEELSTKVAGGGLAHNNMPPYYGIYVIKRTARKFYTV